LKREAKREIRRHGKPGVEMWRPVMGAGWNDEKKEHEPTVPSRELIRTDDDNEGSIYLLTDD
jgi:hypothetical protein